MHRGVAITMENYGRHGSLALRNRLAAAALPHGGERRRKISRGPARKACMNPDGSVDVAIRRAHDGGGGSAGRQARDVDALRIDRMVAHDLARDAGDHRRLAPAPALVALTKPVPALRLVGSSRLLGIGHEAILLLRQEVHPRAGGEIVRRLRATMEHDDQGKMLSLGAARDEQLVGPASGRVAERAGEELRALGYDVRRRWRSASDRTPQANSGKFPHVIERRGMFMPPNRASP